MKNSKPLKIAIQSSGRLSSQSKLFLKSLGIEFEIQDRELITKTGEDIEILSVRDDDIPQYISQGVADFGIVGENVLYEQESKLKIVKKLDFCKCSLVIAVAKNSKIRKLADLENERIATSYPNILKSFLKEKGIKASIITIKGSVEVTPRINLADGICDLTQTGETINKNGLRILTTLLESQAVLIEGEKVTKRKSEFIQRVKKYRMSQKTKTLF